MCEDFNCSNDAKQQNSDIHTFEKHVDASKRKCCAVFFEPSVHLCVALFKVKLDCAAILSLNRPEVYIVNYFLYRVVSNYSFSHQRRKV